MNIERIRAALAAGPTPGPWKIRAERYRFIHVYATGGGICHLDTVDGEGAANAKLITAASPENIAAIIAHVEAQAAEIERLRAALNTCVWALRQPLDDWKGECERKALDEAREALKE